jgi:hypothetical protein
MLLGEQGTPHLHAVFHQVKEQIVLVTIVEIKGGTAHAGVVKHFLHGDLIDGLVSHQLDESVAQASARSPNAQVRLARLAGL